jgi:hypothetical protein
MTQAFRKFQTLSRKVHGWKAKDAQRVKELTNRVKKIMALPNRAFSGF